MNFCPSRSLGWATSKANELIEAALRDPFQETLYQSNILRIEMYINMLIEYQKHLSKLENQINALTQEIEECKIIKSIPGIGKKSRQRLSLRLERKIYLIILKN